MRRAALLVAVAGLHVLTGIEVARAQRTTDIVSILYAGSLGAVMERGLTPAFERASRYRVQAEGHGSVAAARMIRDRLRAPDVFISADPAVNAAVLMGPQNDRIAEWYLTFASAELVRHESRREAQAGRGERASGS